MLDFVTKMFNKKRKPTGFMKHYLTLWSIVDGMEAMETFEFGTGLSTWAILSALNTEAHHTSCDLRPLEGTGVPEHVINAYQDMWTFAQKDSREAIRETNGPFDFVLHDGSHLPDVVEEDLKLVIPKMKNNSILVIHDTECDLFGKTLQEAVVRALGDLRHEIITLPYGYGLTIVRILDNKQNGTVKPTWTKPGWIKEGAPNA